MTTSVTMPRLSDSMEEGTVLQWLKRVGDSVAAGEPLVEIETDKATLVYESDADGTLVEILVQEGDTAALGVVLALIGDGGAPPAARDGTSGRVKASPVARRLAVELGVDVAALAGTGPQGRVVKADVQAAAEGVRRPEPPAPSPSDAARGAARTETLSRLQQTVARRMTESAATIPAFTLFADVDMTGCVALRAELASFTPTPPSYNDLIVKASALTLRAHPRANGAFVDGRFVLYEHVNVGIAVSRPDGLVVPTIFDADRRSLGEIARESARLAAAVRDGSVTPAELAGGTFTVSNLGMYGVAAFEAIVNPGQAAILSVGALGRRAVVDDDGQVVARQMLHLGLTCDHRVLYGADAAGFLADLRRLLEHPMAMAL